MKILLVDDEAPILEETLEVLTDEGFDCLAAGDVGSALELLGENEEISVVITDLFLPGRNGVELIMAAKRDISRDLVFFIVSGHASPTVELKDLDPEDYGFFKKPLDVAKLLETLNELEISGEGGATGSESEK